MTGNRSGYLRETLDHAVEAGQKPNAETLPLLLVPPSRLEDIETGLHVQNDPSGHRSELRERSFPSAFPLPPLG
jgi:hypothetical protein